MHEFMELVWENGEVVTRGLSLSTRTTQPTAKNPHLTHINENTKNSTSSLNKGNSCFQSYETNGSDHPIQIRSFSTKKLGEDIIDSHLIFSKPEDAYGGNNSVKDTETCNNRVDCSTAMIGGSQNNNKKDATSFSRFVRPNLSVSGRRALVLQPSQGDNPMNKDLKACTTRGSCLLVESRGQPALVADSRPSDAKNDPPPDQQSNIVEPLAESSKCSFGASNNPNTIAVRNYPRTEDQQEYHSKDDDQSQTVNKSTPAKGKIGVKNKRIPKLHRLSEKRRRDEIKKRLQTLQELIPNCSKVDKASVLDEAIEYLKTLQFQLQMMSVSTGAYMPPPMMLPSGFMQQLHPPNLPYCPTMDTVRAMMMGGAVPNDLRDRINLQMLGVPSSVSPVVPMTMLQPGVQQVTSFPP